MNVDPYIEFKKEQKGGWASFSPLEIITTIPAASLVKFSHLTANDIVLDVGCGTGVAAITAARAGARVSALDLSPALLEHAKINATLAKVKIDFYEGDVEALPFPDHSFNVILSQFGHMFALRPSVATQEMLRVLKPGGTIAFSTWPPDLFMGHFFRLIEKYFPLPEGIPSPSCWGNPEFVREQLGDGVEELTFDMGMMSLPTLSLGHYLKTTEATHGSIAKLVKNSHHDFTRLNKFRAELEELAKCYFEDNCIHQHYLLSRAKKVS